LKHIAQTYQKTPSVCYCLNLRRASRAITQFYDRVIESSGLTIAQLALLRHLEKSERISVGELARLMRIDRTTLSRNLRPLTEGGLITMGPGKDSRTREVRLTEAGAKAVAQGWVLWGEAQESLRAYLGEEDQARLVELLTRIEALVP